MSDNEAKITQAEMQEMFGDAMPLEAWKLVFESDGVKTVGQIRAELRAISKKKTDRIAYMTREELLVLCERGIVNEGKWTNRDSANAQRQLGEARALLSAGCPFTIMMEGTLKSNGHTIWVRIAFKGFQSFEDGEGLQSEEFYLPTAARLYAAAGGDWY